MKKFVLLLSAALILATIVQAQGTERCERNQFTFKSEKLTDGEGTVTHVKIGAYVAGKRVQEFIVELPGVPMETTADHIGNITETDLNFDGKLDACVYLGYYGSHPNDSYCEALLWDEQQHLFVQSDGYKELPDPMQDEEKHLLCTSLRSGDYHENDYYRWRGNKIEHIRTEGWYTEDTDAQDYSGLLDLPCYRFDASLDGKYPVTIVFQRNDDDIIGGYIYYQKAKVPILIVGSVMKYEDTEYYHLNEYQPDGIVTGNILLSRNVNDEDQHDWQGTWTNPKTRKEMTLTAISYSRIVPKWFTKSVLKPEDPGNIAREYSFQEWNIGSEDYMGGHISFRAVGKNKVHFECCNVRHNIAEGSSEQGRPAVLNGNKFEYRDVNECGYGFRATFFPRFLVINTITDYPTLDCFGANASFEGVYIKTKQ